VGPATFMYLLKKKGPQTAEHRLELLLLLLSLGVDCRIVCDVLPLLELVYLVVEHIGGIQRTTGRVSCRPHLVLAESQCTTCMRQ
jgi:hypothetical protein